MITTVYGYKVPQSSDKGPIVFPAMELNINRVNDHDHEGANSKPLGPRALLAETVTLLAANWASVGNGMYKQAVTMPALMDFDKVHKEFRLADESEFYPTIIRLSATQYEVYINDNSQDVKVLYK